MKVERANAAWSRRSQVTVSPGVPLNNFMRKWIEMTGGGTVHALLANWVSFACNGHRVQPNVTKIRVRCCRAPLS